MTPDAAPDISVVVPVHSRFGVLGSCLEALAGQSFPAERWEALLVANGVEEGDWPELEAVVGPWQERLGGRLRLLRIPEASIPRARNAGVRAARGRIVLQMNEDTILSETALEQHYGEHEATGFNVRQVVAGGRRFPEEYRSSLMNYLYEAAELYTPLHEEKPRFLGDHHWFVTCNLSSLRAAYDRFGRYEPTIDWCSDTELGKRWRAQGCVITVNTGIISYHLHWLTFDSYRRNCIRRVPYRIRWRTGKWPRELTADECARVRRRLGDLPMPDLRTEAFEREMHRLEEQFEGPDWLAGRNVMGERVETKEEAVRRLQRLCRTYSTKLLFRELDHLLPDGGRNDAERASSRGALRITDTRRPGRPRVTVLLPTYNRPRYLAEAIRSVVRQDMPDWELLVINDGGTDVADIVEGFGDRRIRYFSRRQNRGKAACLNFGLRRAHGDYIAYLDDDDVWYPQHLGTLARVLDEEPEVGVAYSDLFKTICLTDSAGNRHPLEKRVDVCRDFNRMLMFHFNHTLHVSLMHRRELLERAGGYREDVRVLIDWNLTRKLAFYTDFRHVEAVTGEYFVPIKDSDRISDVEREDEESYLANLRRIRADLPPEPWPEVRRVAVVVPVAEGDEAEADLLRYLCDKLDYPCRIVLADRSSDGAAAGRLPADLVDLEHIHTVRAGQGGVGAACAAGARAVEADLYMLIGPGLDPSAEQRLIRAVCYMEETGCAGVRWPEDDAWGRPFNVLIGRRAALGAAEPPTGEWPATETMPGDWVPPALESDYLLSFASRCEAEGDYESALHLLNDADAIQEGGTCTPYVVQRLARVAFAVGQYGQAERMCRRLIRAGYGADNCVRLGYICQSQDRWEEAVCAYREGLQMIGLDEEDLSSDAFPLAGPVEFDAFRAMAGLGECLVQMERDGEAAKVLRRAARLRADSLRPPLAFGRMFLRRGELDRAEEAFKLAAGQETRGRVTAVWVGLAEVCERRGQMTEAHRHWRTALDAASQNEEFLEQAVRTGRGVVSAEELAGLYKEFLQYRPGHVPALVGLAELWLESGRHREARALLDRALLLSPEDERARSAATRLTA